MSRQAFAASTTSKAKPNQAQWSYIQAAKTMQEVEKKDPFRYADSSLNTYRLHRDKAGVEFVHGFTYDMLMVAFTMKTNTKPKSIHIRLKTLAVLEAPIEALALNLKHIYQNPQVANENYIYQLRHVNGSNLSPVAYLGYIPSSEL